MTFRRLSDFLRLSTIVLVVSAFCPTLHAQALLASATVPQAPTPAIEPVSPVVITPPVMSVEHKFWDKQNRVLFITAAASNGADFAVTRANLQSGGQELNPVVRMFGRSKIGRASGR